MYPRNAASPPEISVGSLVSTTDGSLATTGASVRVKSGGSWAAGAGTLSCDATSGIWSYVPTQGETNASHFIVAVYRSGHVSIERTVVTTVSDVAGYAGVDWSKVTAATSTVALSGTTISASQVVASVTGAVGSVTSRVTANTDQWGGVAVTGMPLPTASYTAPPSAATNATAVRSELATELGRMDAAVSSRSTLTAAGVRTELAVELGRIDVTLSSRLAASVYVAPDNATIGTISINLATVNNNVLSRLAASSYVAPLSAADTRTALGLASANLDTQLADLPTVAEFEARTLAAAGYASSTHWTSTRAGYLDSVLLAANANRTVQVTGSNHVAADIHELQPAVITSAAFASGWLTAAGTAADYITELQTAIGTATNQTAILDRVSFALSALAGNCSTAQTATETYVLAIGGNTYTAAYSGLDGSGNRSTTTLTKA